MSRSRHNRPPRATKANAVLAAWDVVRDTNKQRLIEQIEAAFDGVELGNGLSLHQAAAIDGYESSEAVAQARELDPETRWQDVTDEKIGRMWLTFAFLDAEGFRFYFPRLMVHDIQHGTASVSSLFWAEQRGERFSLFSPAQTEAVRAFVDFFRDDR